MAGVRVWMIVCVSTRSCLSCSRGSRGGICRREMGCSPATAHRRLAEWQAVKACGSGCICELLRRLNGAGRIDWSTAVVDGSHIRALLGGSTRGHRRLTVPGLGSKHHLITDSGGIPLAITLTGGNRNDVTQLLLLVDGVGPVTGKPGRPRQRAERVLADRGYDHDKYRRELWERGVKPVIARRSTKHGSGLGKERWVVERTFALVPQSAPTADPLRARSRPAHGVHAARLRRGLPAQTDRRLSSFLLPLRHRSCAVRTGQGSNPSPRSPPAPRARSRTPPADRPSPARRCSGGCQLSPRSKTYSNSSPGLTSLATFSFGMVQPHHFGRERVVRDSRSAGRPSAQSCANAKDPTAQTPHRSPPRTAQRNATGRPEKPAQATDHRRPHRRQASPPGSEATSAPCPKQPTEVIETASKPVATRTPGIPTASSGHKLDSLPLGLQCPVLLPGLLLT